MAQYRPLVDLNGHTGMGGKTVPYLVDRIYGGKGWAGMPSKWAMMPFNNNWLASLFLSMDQVAIDSVGFDFLSQQWPDQTLGNEAVQDYLHEMALANNPPSGMVYEPEHDGVAMASQGVHEHWNNVTQKHTAQGTGVLLKWTHFAWNDAYEVYRSGSPYFTPDETSHVGDVTPRERVSRHPVGQHTVLPDPRQQNGLGVISNRTGKFQFDLTVP
jgi:hypothetical protein